MKSMLDHLAQYAAYHRDPRNIATHFVGIPMITLAVAILLAHPALAYSGIGAAHGVAAMAALFYLRLDWRFGAVMALLLAAAVRAAGWFAAQSFEVWLGWGVGLFVVGWIVQFIGHYYEQRKPAFVDDLVGLLIGPLFVVVEAAFMIGLRRSLQAGIERRVGPTRRQRGRLPV